MYFLLVCSTKETYDWHSQGNIYVFFILTQKLYVSAFKNLYLKRFMFRDLFIKIGVIKNQYSNVINCK